MGRFAMLACVVATACAPRPTPQAEQGAAIVPGGQLHYEIAGSGEALVLIHGANLDRRMWDEQFAAFARHYRVVRYDVRGYGLSSSTAIEFASYEDLRTLLDRLEIDKARLVGHSLGGRIAVDFALTYPERVVALVLAGPNISGWAFSSQDHAFVAEIGAAAGAGEVERAAEIWLASPYMAPAMEDPVLAPRLRQWLRDNDRIWTQPFLELSLDPPATARLAELQMPLLLVVGSRDLPDRHRIVDSIERHAPQAKKLILPGAGHLVNLERPREFNDAVLEFLSR